MELLKKFSPTGGKLLPGAEALFLSCPWSAPLQETALFLKVASLEESGQPQKVPLCYVLQEGPTPDLPLRHWIPSATPIIPEDHVGDDIGNCFPKAEGPTDILCVAHVPPSPGSQALETGPNLHKSGKHFPPLPEAMLVTNDRRAALSAERRQEVQRATRLPPTQTLFHTDHNIRGFVTDGSKVSSGIKSPSLYTEFF